MKKIFVPRKKNSDIDRLDFEILSACALKKPREFLLIHPEYKLKIIERLKLAYFLFLRRRGYPVAYITRQKEFFGLDFYVNKNVLIPRPETELMVEEANKKLSTSDKNALMIDVGTGSGCIPISIAKTLKQKKNWRQKNLTIYATDISRVALRVADKNAREHKIKIQLFKGDLLKPIIKKHPFISSISSNFSSLIITANLPYLTRKQFDKEPSIKREPKKALVADNKNGLALYEKLLKQIGRWTYLAGRQAADDGQKTTDNEPRIAFHIIMEIDPKQTDEMKTLIKKYLPRANVEIKKDLAGLDRIVIATLD
ncbi:MAG: peptide chain release factor N(5)-glutamine methyltransferase [Patescibacteria group bacterium]|nr:peptide chain release factor N(5)-glutamine methyltransferase [Patescibacteria group bacterium]